MQPASDLDGIDFKPFFDMVVGVLFVLLILIGALLFFQTAQTDATAKQAQAQKLAQQQAEEARKRQEWRVERTAFLDWIAGHLKERGIAASVDPDNASIAIPLATMAKLGDDGLPALASDATDKLGGTLAHDLACVAAQSDYAGDCAAFHLLRLDTAAMEVRIAPLGPGATLSQDRFGRLLASLLTAELLKGSPDLLRLSGSAGGVIVTTASAVAAGAVAAPGAVGGDLAIGFAFTPP
jgi:hypothetical protein